MSGHETAPCAELPVVELLGFHVCCAERSVVLAWLWRRLTTGQATQVVTLNPEMIMAARQDRRLTDLIEQADLRVADGIGLTLAAWMLGPSLLPRYPGIDLARDLLERCSLQGRPVYLLGAEAGVAAEAGANLTRELPGLNICGSGHGYFAEGESDSVAETVSRARPELLLVAMGFPRQEQFIAEQRSKLGPAVMIGIGGALDVFAGRQKRAPQWIRRIGMEWAFRVARNATRLSRLAALPRFVRLVLRESIGAAN